MATAGPTSFPVQTTIGVGTDVQYVVERGASLGALVPATIVVKNASYGTDGSVDLKNFQDGDNGVFNIVGAKYDTAGTVPGTWRLIP